MSKETTKAKVTVFGNEVDETETSERWRDRRCRLNNNHPSGFLGGFLILFFGIVFLLNNLGVVPWNVWNGIGHFWPVILIVVGIEILLGQSTISRFVSFLLSLFVFGTVFGIIILRSSPTSLNGAPQEVTSYLNTVNNYLKIK